MPTSAPPLVRAIEVVVDRASWQAQPSQFRHPFPRSLGQQRGPFPVHLLVMLLRLGELTTPILNIQSGVARLWPLLRYLHVLADTPGFRFRSGWADTDGHQKAIASDDLGVGLGMTVLYAAFDYVACLDGRAFLRRLAQLGLLASGTPPKVGAMKMADYAALDRAGKYHVIECKGSQHSHGALVTAMEEGQWQKRSFVCGSRGAETRIIGQRLVVGAFIVLEGALRDTQVIVMDPAPLAEDPPVLVQRVPSASLREVGLRLEVARAFGTAGSFRTAVAVAQTDLPTGAPALSGPAQRDRVQAALAQDETELEQFDEFGESWIGQRVVVPLLAPLVVGERAYRYARLSKGVSVRLAAELRERSDGTPLFQELYPEAATRVEKEKDVSGEDYAVIVRPGLSISTIELLEQPKT